VWVAVACSSYPDASHAFVLLSGKDADLACRRLDVGKFAGRPEPSYRLWVIDARMGVACHASLVAPARGFGNCFPRLVRESNVGAP
jgi:hypothetical protein